MLKAGIHFDVPTAEYFADPCPSPSLTQSIAKILIERSPLHAWTEHPRLNPDFKPDDDTKFDIGNIAHKLMLGRGKELVVLDKFDDWRTNAAKSAREEAAAEGKLAVLGKHFARADRMVRAGREQLELRRSADLFSDKSASEVVLVWQEGEIWLRQMVDWLSSKRQTFADFKSTDMSVAPQNLGRMMVNAGWHIQAAMAERGLNVLDPASAGRRRYLFVVQETSPPYALNVVQLSEAALTMGRKQLDHAVEQWRACMMADLWPGYPTEIVVPEFPGWAEHQWLEREVVESESKPRMLTSLAGG